MPLEACPGRVQRNSYVPFVVNAIVRLADWFGASRFVAVPVHVFAADVLTALVHTLKSWVRIPLFVTLNVTFPTGRSEDFESLKPSSSGSPAATVTTATRGA